MCFSSRDSLTEVLYDLRGNHWKNIYFLSIPCARNTIDREDTAAKQVDVPGQRLQARGSGDLGGGGEWGAQLFVRVWPRGPNYHQGPT